MARTTTLRNREQTVQEIDRVQRALQKTKSHSLKTQYARHLSRLQKELRDYDRFRYGTEVNDGKTKKRN